MRESIPRDSSRAAGGARLGGRAARWLMPDDPDLPEPTRRRLRSLAALTWLGFLGVLGVIAFIDTVGLNLLPSPWDEAAEALLAAGSALLTALVLVRLAGALTAERG